MDGLRVLVADDERPARDKLRRFLEEDPSVSVVFEARNGANAIDVVRAERPDVVFLDIRMPGMDGLVAAESIAEIGGPHIVFVTAYDEHAIRAFELGAADYLLKPFDRERFAAAFGRVQAALATEQMAADAQQLRDTIRAVAGTSPIIDRIKVEDGGRTRLLELVDIIRVDSAGNYVKVLTQDAEFRLRSTMTELERRLPGNQFARVNRSQIVNVRFIRDLTPAGHGDLDVRLTDGSNVRLSRRYRDRVQGWE